MPGAAPHPGRTRLTAGATIGPNCLIQTVHALRERLGAAAADAWLATAGFGDLVERLPDTMVPEARFVALSQALHRELGPADAAAVLRRAGERTGDYLLAHRIPRVARLLLPRLPARLALRLLVRGIGAHAWTFAGSGEFHMDWGLEPAFVLRHCPGCRGRESATPDCSYYEATFARLLQALVDPAVQVVETSCEASGAGACRFHVRLPSSRLQGSLTGEA